MYADLDQQNLMNTDPDADPDPGQIQVNKISQLISTHPFNVERKNDFQICTLTYFGSDLKNIISTKQKKNLVG